MNLAQSVGGLKTQQGYIRQDIQAIRRKIDDVRFFAMLSLWSLCVFYATVFIGWFLR